MGFVNLDFPMYADKFAENLVVPAVGQGVDESSSTDGERDKIPGEEKDAKQRDVAENVCDEEDHEELSDEDQSSTGALSVTENRPIPAGAHRVLGGDRLSQPRKRFRVGMTDRVDCQYDKPIPFINDHDALAELFRQIRLGARELLDVERLNHPKEYSQMARIGFSSFAYSNELTLKYERTIQRLERNLREAAILLGKSTAESRKYKGEYNQLVKEKSKVQQMRQEWDDAVAEARRMREERDNAKSFVSSELHRLRDANSRALLEAEDEMRELFGSGWRDFGSGWRGMYRQVGVGGSERSAETVTELAEDVRKYKAKLVGVVIEDITDADYLPPFRAKIRVCVQEGDVRDALPEDSSPVTKDPPKTVRPLEKGMRRDLEDAMGKPRKLRGEMGRLMVFWRVTAGFGIILLFEFSFLKRVFISEARVHSRLITVANKCVTPAKGLCRVGITSFSFEIAELRIEITPVRLLSPMLLAKIRAKDARGISAWVSSRRVENQVRGYTWSREMGTAAKEFGRSDGNGRTAEERKQRNAETSECWLGLYPAEVRGGVASTLCALVLRFACLAVAVQDGLGRHASRLPATRSSVVSPLRTKVERVLGVHQPASEDVVVSSALEVRGWGSRLAARSSGGIAPEHGDKTVVIILLC
ncbi:hypothetical protein Bca4012_026689 [Brassica carinata]